MCLNTYFQFLNNITHIFTLFYSHVFSHIFLNNKTYVLSACTKCPFFFQSTINFKTFLGKHSPEGCRKLPFAYLEVEGKQEPEAQGINMMVLWSMGSDPSALTGQLLESVEPARHVFGDRIFLLLLLLGAEFFFFISFFSRNNF